MNSPTTSAPFESRASALDSAVFQARATTTPNAVVTTEITVTMNSRENRLALLATTTMGFTSSSPLPSEGMLVPVDSSLMSEISFPCALGYVGEAGRPDDRHPDPCVQPGRFPIMPLPSPGRRVALEAARGKEYRLAVTTAGAGLSS